MFILSCGAIIYVLCIDWTEVIDSLSVSYCVKWLLLFWIVLRIKQQCSEFLWSGGSLKGKIVYVKYENNDEQNINKVVFDVNNSLHILGDMFSYITGF